jgi:SecD/SecF fusion protein
MQLKGLVKVLTIFIILICLYQLSFTFFVNNFENKQKAKAREYVKKNFPDLKEKTQAYDDKVGEAFRTALDSSGNKKIGFGTKYAKAKDQELKLGLDLQGGMNVVLEVSTDELIRNMSNSPADPALKNAIASAMAARANSQTNFVDLFASAYKSQNPNGKLAPLFVKPGTDGISNNSSNEEVINKLRSSAKEGVKNTYEVIRKRIDKFGVSSPTINLDETRDMITVELAGVQNPEKVRNYLQSAAKLEFWETYSNYELVNNIKEANKALISLRSGTTAATADTTKKTTADTTKAAGLSDLLGGSKDTSKNSNDTSAVAKANREYPLIKYLNPQIQTDPKTGKYYENAIMGYIMQSDTAELNGAMREPLVRAQFPSNFKLLFGRPDAEVLEKEPKLLYIYAIKTVPGSEKPYLGGEHVTEARSDYNPANGKPEITMKMDQTGALAWERLTGSNVGKPVAIALDDVVYSAPAPVGPIAGGSSSINGNFTKEETDDISNILKSGKIDAPAHIVQEQTVGPTLGAENISAGKMSFLLAFLVIFALMLVYYNTGGIVANIALIINLLFTIGILSALGFTLTMAGIAGLILTIGMAVDTNVIIFERIKEELAGGKNHKDAIDEGYKRSLAPVLDGHVTVFLTAAILAYFGLGPVLGFATTQMLGITLSLFCGILVSRVITDMFMSKGKHLEYFTGLSKTIFKKFNFHFIQWRKYAYIISGLVLVLGIASFFNGFDYGIEFRGGRSYTVKLDKAATTTEIREGLKSALSGFPEVKTIGNANTVNITTDYLIAQSGKEADAAVAQKLYDGLSNMGAVAKGQSMADFANAHITSSQTVLPTISDDLKSGAIKALIWSLIIIFIYILIRFRKWQYSLGTVVALLHDVFVTLAVFSFCRKFVPFSLQIDQHFIAAILTVIGFSMNDTVIVFDRIREYFRKRPNADKAEVINSAINDTLSRTIMTSLTVFLTILILFIFGGEAVRGFAFAMLIGVITGTYSSIFVAAPILVDLDKKGSLAVEEDREAKIKALKEMS